MNTPNMHFATSSIQSQREIEHPVNPDESIGFDGQYDEGEIL